MPKTTVYFFKKYDINKNENVLSKRMATLEAIQLFGQCVPIIESAWEVNISELDENGRFPKTFKVIYFTNTFPILSNKLNNTGRMSEPKEYYSYKEATSAPFPEEDNYIFAAINVGRGWHTRKVDGKWEFQKLWGNPGEIA